MPREQTGLSPELRFLLSTIPLGARRPPAEAPLGLDWQRVLHLVHEHRLLPLVAGPLAAMAGIPPQFRDELALRRRALAARSLAATAELLRITDQFTQAGIPVLAFKGPTLAMRLYGSPAGRHFQDLDLLVPPENALQATALLEEDGYQNTQRIPAARTAQFIRRHCEFGHIHPTGSSVEIHWRLLKPEWGHDERLTKIAWTQPEELEIHGHLIQTVSWDVLVAFLILHGHKHHWMRLQWLVDVAQAIEEDPDLMRRLEDLLPDWKRVLACTWMTCDLLLGTQLSQRSSLPAPPTADRLHRILVRGIAKDQGDGLGPVRRHRYLTQSLDRRSHRIRYWLSRLRPDAPEWTLVTLPRGLYGLYWLLRPVRVVFARNRLRTEAPPRRPPAW